MPEDKKNEDLIDVGETEGAEINLDEKGEAVKQEEVKEEIEVEQVPEDKTYENEKQVKLDDKKPEEKDELKEYSEGVQKRIAKLTRKMREAERQREEAIAFAESAKKDKEDMEESWWKKKYIIDYIGWIAILQNILHYKILYLIIKLIWNQLQPFSLFFLL